MMPQTKLIEFINFSDVENLLPPTPTSKMLPQWYKDIESYLPESKKEVMEKDGNKQSTIKKCVPVFDSLTAGYFFVTGADLEITQENGIPLFTWACLDMIKFHPLQQLSNYPGAGPHAVPKLNNSWGYKTPKGYSCLFIPPMNRDNEIVVLPAIVDTDTFNHPVNFPFLLKNPNYEGLIPKGTPIVQIIPFKRDGWRNKVIQKDFKARSKIEYILNSVFRDGYRNNFWQKKEYK